KGILEMKDKLPDWEDLHRAGVDIGAIVEKAQKQKHNGKVIQLHAAQSEATPAKHVKQHEQHIKQEAIPALPAELVDGTKLFDEARSFYRRFIAYPSEHAAIAHVLWTVHTHLMDCWETTPRLAFMSQEKRSGKTRAMELTKLLAYNAHKFVNPTPAVVMRLIGGDDACTILHDEVDSVYGNRQRQEGSGDLTAVYNDGYRFGASVPRCVGPNHEVRFFNAYAPLAVSGLRQLPDTLADRAIIIGMKRQAPNEKVEPFYYRDHAEQAEAIKQQIEWW